MKDFVQQLSVEVRGAREKSRVFVTFVAAVDVVAGFAEVAA